MTEQNEISNDRADAVIKGANGRQLAQLCVDMHEKELTDDEAQAMADSIIELSRGILAT